MKLNRSRIVDEIAAPAFTVDENRRIEGWNKAAEALLGHEARQVIGRNCYEVNCGLDIWGNRWCDRACNLRNIVRRGEQIQNFIIQIRSADYSRQLVQISCRKMTWPKANQYLLLHILHPIEKSEQIVNLISTLKRIEEGLALDVASPTSSNKKVLTPREIEVLGMLAHGVPPLEIADNLNVSIATIRTHIQRVLKKLNAHNLIQALSIANWRGML